MFEVKAAILQSHLQRVWLIVIKTCSWIQAAELQSGVCQWQQKTTATFWKSLFWFFFFAVNISRHIQWPASLWVLFVCRYKAINHLLFCGHVLIVFFNLGWSNSLYVELLPPSLPPIQETTNNVNLKFSCLSWRIFCCGSLKCVLLLFACWV